MSTQAVEAAVNIRDYFLDKDLAAYYKASGSYEVLLQNNTDFIIARKTKKTDKELVILISQGLFYFKEAKGGSIEEVTFSKLKSYFKDLNYDCIELNQVLWLPKLDKYTIERLEKIISNDVFVDMCRHNILIEIRDPYWYSKYWEQNQKLFIKLHSIFPTITDVKANKYRSSLPIIFEIDKRYGYNEAMFFAETLLLSGVDQYTSAKDWHRNYNYRENEIQVNLGMEGYLQLLNEPYSLNQRRLIEYIFYDAYSQGIVKIDETFWKTYEDYLAMQIKIFGRINEKYPKSLKTEHDIMALKVNTAEIVAKCEDFTARSAEIADLSYTGKIYSIIVPDTPQQLADEGINLSHCVGSYVDRIINNECHILFLRKTQTPDESLVTLQLCRGRINQAEGNRRRRISEEERTFLMNWGQAKNIQIAV